jgi:tRNA(Ile)-lysidine synthase
MGSSEGRKFPLNAGHLVGAAEFAASMAALAPFEPAPRLAAGVSGGADSMALALLADAWARERGGALLALIVDHGLRQESGAEAAGVAARLGARGIAARVLTIRGLARGTALAERARVARFRILVAACAEEGILHLLLGHHAADQAETVLIRALGGSGSAGMAGMASLVEIGGLRILRPLLAVFPEELRAVVASAGATWVEDPSNFDPVALRPRLRLLRRDRDGEGAATAALIAAAASSGRQRADDEATIAAGLAERVSLRPEGFGVLSEGAIQPRVLAALLQTIAGAPYPPPTNSIASLAAAPRKATLAGVRLLPAGRQGRGLLVVREAAAMAPPVPALAGAVWDGRFRMAASARVPAEAMLGALGADAARLRRSSSLPSAVLQTLPAVRLGTILLAVPHLVYPDPEACAGFPMIFSPPRPAAAASFLISNARLGMHEGLRHPMLANT